MNRRPLTAAACAMPLLVCNAVPAQFADNFDDGDLEGWTAMSTGSATLSVPDEHLEIRGLVFGRGAALLDVSLADPDGYAEGDAFFDLELDIGGRPIEAGIEVRGNPATGSAMVFGIFNNNPGGPGATIGLRESAEGPMIKLAAPSIPFDASHVRVRVEWSETEYTLTVSNLDQSGQSVRFRIETPPPSSAAALSLYAQPVPGADTSEWSASFDNFRATPGTVTDCDADVNGDGSLTPADYNAWIIAFNTDAPECDQNGDGQCTPADFNGWIINWNTGCG